VKLTTNCKRFCAAFIACAGVMLTPGLARGQKPVQVPPVPVLETPAQQPARVPDQLRVDVVLTRLQGDKKIGSLPFVLWVSAAARRMQTVSMRMGVDVPIGTRTASTGGREGAPSVTTTTPEYKHVGTQVDCAAWETGDGRYFVDVRVQDTSIYTADSAAAAIAKGDPPAFKSFLMSNTRPLRIGQTEEFARATDPVSGEIILVQVTINQAK